MVALPAAGLARCQRFAAPAAPAPSQGPATASCSVRGLGGAAGVWGGGHAAGWEVHPARGVRVCERRCRPPPPLARA